MSKLIWLMVIIFCALYLLPPEQKVLGFMLWAMMLGIYSKLDDVKK